MPISRSTLKRWKRDALEDLHEMEVTNNKGPLSKHLKRLAQLVSELETYPRFQSQAIIQDKDQGDLFSHMEED